MSLKKQALRARRQEADQEKAFRKRVVKVGAVAALFAALSGPVAAVPIDDPRRPREQAAWTPTPKDPPPNKRPEGKDRQLDPVMHRSSETIGTGDLYVRKVKGGHFGELGARSRDRIRDLEALLLSLGVRPTPRQIKRIVKGHHWPPELERWLASKERAGAARGGRP
jgi:hypothetical protein